ncbi:hypothetical protein EV361DRAFT_955931 [Lentinula raphanica]|nr:hypothetical protein EV361DRAFT_955931 [Lentinula raphanica]
MSDNIPLDEQNLVRELPRTPINKKTRTSLVKDAHKTPGAGSPNRSRRKTPASRDRSEERPVLPTPGSEAQYDAIYRSFDNDQHQVILQEVSLLEGPLVSSSGTDAPMTQEAPRPAVATEAPNSPVPVERMSVADDGEANPFQVEHCEDRPASPGSTTGSSQADVSMAGSLTPTPTAFAWPTRDDEDAKTPRLRDLRPNGYRAPPDDSDPLFPDLEGRLVNLPATGGDTTLPVYVGNLAYTLHGFTPEMIEEMKGKSSEYVSITPFNAGRYLYRAVRDSSQRIEDLLAEINIEARIIAPYRLTLEGPEPIAQRGNASRGGPRGRGCGRGRGRGGYTSTTTGAKEDDQYAGPIALAAHVPDPSQRDFLLQMGTISYSAVTTFHVQRFYFQEDLDPQERSWAVCLLHTTDRITEERTKETLYAIKHACWNNPRLAKLVAQAYPGLIPTPLKLIKFTDGFELLPQPYKYQSNGINQSCWILFAAPIACRPDPILRAKQENEIRKLVANPPL